MMNKMSCKVEIKIIFLIMCHVSAWNVLCKRCQEVYEKKSGLPPIPTMLSDDPHRVFLDTHVEVNVGRFVAFILLLKQQPFAFGWYRFIRHHHSEVFEESLVRMSLYEETYKKKAEGRSLCRAIGLVPRSRRDRESGRRGTICQSSTLTRGHIARDLGGRSGVHFTQTHTTTVSHLTSLGDGYGQTVDRRFD